MATGLEVKPAAACRWDVVALGEVMLRFDPGCDPVASAREFRVWEGGGEYNVARGLAHCFGQRATIVTALVDNPLGRLVQDLIRQGGVDPSHVRHVPFDGIGRAARNGLYFMDRGFGARAPQSCSDRGHTAISQLKPGVIDWERIFGREGARWFHTGGIFCGLSDASPAVAREAMQAARKYGAVVSYDLNYRESLWRATGGKARADEVCAELAPLVDVMFGRADVEGTAREFTNLKLVATNVRTARTASRCDWGGYCWAAGQRHEARLRLDVDVLDRVGSGDAFAAGVIYALLAGKDPKYAVECGAAHGALVMTTPGDHSMATLADVEHLMRGGDAKAQR